MGSLAGWGLRTSSARALAVVVAAIMVVITAAPAAAAPDDGYGAPAPLGGQRGLSFPSVLAALTFGPAGGLLQGEIAQVSLTVTIPPGSLANPSQIALAEGSAAAAQREFASALSSFVVVGAVAITRRVLESGDGASPLTSQAAPKALSAPPASISVTVTPKEAQYREGAVLVAQPGQPDALLPLGKGDVSVSLAAAQATLLILMPASSAVVTVTRDEQTVASSDDSGPLRSASEAIADHPIWTAGVLLAVGGALVGVMRLRRSGS